MIDLLPLFVLLLPSFTLEPWSCYPATKQGMPGGEDGTHKDKALGATSNDIPIAKPSSIGLTLVHLPFIAPAASHDFLTRVVKVANRFQSSFCSSKKS